MPQVDIVIDDGGHRMQQQITSFEELYPHIQPHGVYLCEDIHTSFWPDFDGGYRRAGTFLEYSKGLIDRLYAWYTPRAANALQWTNSRAAPTPCTSTTACWWSKSGRWTRRSKPLPARLRSRPRTQAGQPGGKPRGIWPGTWGICPTRQWQHGGGALQIHVLAIIAPRGAPGTAIAV